MNRTDSQLLIVILILILIGGVAAHAQVPELINYQGRLVDGGALVNGNTQIVFRIYNQSSGGSPLWQETQTVAAVDGLFSAHIGASNDTAGTLSDVLTNASCFLEIKVGTTVMGPREQVLAVPYSLQADGVPPGAISSAMLADGAVTVDKIATGAVTGDKIGDVDNLAISGTLSARILEVAGGGGQVLQFAQATSDGGLVHVDSDDPGGFAYGVWGDGSFIYLANGDGGLHTYSVDGAGNLTHIDSDDQGDDAYGVWGDDSFIYLANGYGGLHTYSVDGSGYLTHIDSDDQGGCAYGIWGDGSFIYLADGSGGLHTYSVDGSGNLTHIDSDDQGGYADGEI
ncbi:MAG: hypothetical protein KJ626_06710 [Verrucomicrobia bacterium]|nr:hypothetical protein [Verrucomicrobiota bacterium]